MNLRFPILLAVAILSGAATTTHSAPARVISFSGYDWLVKDFPWEVGPGPNYFSQSTRNVWVDTSGRLHLKIEKRKGIWYCAEVICTESLGYGTYQFHLDSDVAGLDPNVVLGLFTWSDTPDDNHREIDIEFSRWGDRYADNAQFVVQPYYFAGNLWTYFLPAGLLQSTHSFSWSPGSVVFRSASGTGDVIAGYLNAGPDVPSSGDETPRINLWLRQGLRPTNRENVEVIIRRFEFEPL